MICLICRQAEVVAGLTSVYFERQELQLAISSVPALICPSCAEAYIDEAVAVWLLQTAETISDMGVLDARVEYGA